MRTKHLQVSALPSWAVVTGFPAAAAGDAASGPGTANENCARWHQIEKGGPFKLRPPSFQSIANYRKPDDVWARTIALSPHSGMPETQWTLKPGQVERLAASVSSLDTPVSIPPQ